jgi:hypothetical protein
LEPIEIGFNVAKPNSLHRTNRFSLGTNKFSLGKKKLYRTNRFSLRKKHSSSLQDFVKKKKNSKKFEFFSIYRKIPAYNTAKKNLKKKFFLHR